MRITANFDPTSGSILISRGQQHWAARSRRDNHGRDGGRSRRRVSPDRAVLTRLILVREAMLHHALARDKVVDSAHRNERIPCR